MSRYRAVLLDMDGTLIDTAPGVIACAKDCLNILGVPEPPEEVFHRFIGPPLPECFRLITGLDAEFCDRAAELYKTLFGQKYIAKFSLYPGMYDLLAECHSNGILLGIATFKQPVHMKAALEYLKIDHFFSSAVGTDPKSTLSKSEIINIAVSELGLPRNKDILMIGDSFYDYEGAKASGVDFAAAAYGYGFTDTDEIPGSCVAHDVSALIQFVFSKE